MSTNRMIKDSFWTDSYIENLDPIEKLLFIYLLTNPLCNIAGIYQIQTKRIAFEIGIDKEMVDKLLTRLQEDGKILRDKDWLLIVNHAKHQSFKNPNVTAGIKRIIDELPNEVKALKGFERLSHFTLLNLTIPNYTVSEDKEDLVVEEIATEPKKDVAEVIKLFEAVDPKNKTYYGNKTQRAACLFLLQEYGLEEIKKRIEVLPRTNVMPYFPNITTPCQLRDKWVQLNARIERHKAEREIKSELVAF